MEIVEIFVFWRKYFQSLLIFVFLYPKTSNFHNSWKIGRRKLSDPSMNNTFNVLSICLQHTLSCKWPDFGFKCLFTITSTSQSNLVYEIFLILKQAAIIIHFLSFLTVIELYYGTEKKDGVQMGMWFSRQSGFS